MRDNSEYMPLLPTRPPEKREYVLIVDGKTMAVMLVHHSALLHELARYAIVLLHDQ